MSEPGAVRSVRRWRHAPVAALVAAALGLGLMCASFAVGGATMLASTDMAPVSTTMDLAVADAEQVAALAPTMANMCDEVCASDTDVAICSVAAMGGPLTVLGLLLTRRRETFLGMLARTTGPRYVRRERRTWRGWSLVSPVSLCVWRV